MRNFAPLIAAATLVAVTGCSSNSHQSSDYRGSSPVAGGSPPSRASTGGCVAQYAPVICAAVDVTGSATVAGTSTVVAPVGPGDDPNVSCGQLAKESDGGSRELGDNLVQVGADHTNVAWDASFAHYTGPATYSGADLAFSVTVGDVTFEPDPGGTVTVTVGPDFTTTMKFDALRSAETDGNTISGSVSWTCADLG